METGLLSDLKTGIQTSRFSPTKRQIMDGKIDELIQLVAQERAGIDDFFKAVQARIREKVRYGKLRFRHYEMLAGKEAIDAFLGRGKKIAGELAALHQLLNAENMDLMADGDSLLLFLQNMSDIFAEFVSDAAYVFYEEAEDVVHWIEYQERYDNQFELSLSAVPIDISEILQAKLFEMNRSVILTSATISINGNFKFFQRRIGIEDLPNQKNVILPRMFDYTKQAAIMTAGFLPEISSSGGQLSPHFHAQAIRLLKQIMRVHPRGMLILFTSYYLLTKFYDSLKDFAISQKISLLAQGKSGSRSAILDKFKRDTQSVLLGTESFWEGVDVPGKALEILVITKIPFAVPSEPIIEGILDKLKSEGKNAFNHYSLPLAVLKFKQGFGRLIRKKDDRGVLLILDSRIHQKYYGRLFASALPCPIINCGNEGEIISRMTNLFWDM